MDEGPFQFVGSVSNVNFFVEDDYFKDIQHMSSNMCNYTGGFINQNSKWGLFGNVKENKKLSRTICNKDQTYRVAVPAKITLPEAIEMCDKFGSGNLTEIKNSEDMEFTLSLFKSNNYSCLEVWTPLTDEEEEGQFKSYITGSLASYLPWDPLEPNGLETENFVTIKIDSSRYSDRYSTKPVCASCDLAITSQFFLIGICKDSYFGKFILL